MDNFEGQTFAGYEILSKLGQGGMGAVYKARQTMLNRLVALKMMAPNLSGDPAFVARFIREASAAANLNHPNMVQVYTAGENDKIYYIVMEFVEGESLRIRLDRMGRIPAQEAVAITVYIAQALQYAWNKAHLIHRDIKPDNIFLSNAGEVKVGDLGLAKSVGGGETTDMTQTGMVMGSPHYISPEQAQGAKDIDFHADIYSLGCTLFHMLTGKTPYEGDSSMAIMMKHINEPAPAIFKTWPACPMPLGRLVGKMVAKRRQERHASYEELVADLMQVHEKLRQSESIAPVATTPAPAAVADTVPKARQTDAGVTTQAKAGNQKLIYAAGGVCAAVALAGLLWWSPWKTPQRESVTVISQGQPSQPAEPPRQESVAPITSPAPATPLAPSAQPQPGTTADAAWQNAINLLALVDVAQDAVKGQWGKRSDGLSAKQGSALRLQFPYAPPEEYDFRVEFTIQQGNPDVAQLIAAGGRNFAWKMGCAPLGNRSPQPNLFWFERVPGPNPTRTFLPWSLEVGRRYTSIVQVRKEGLEGIVNDQTVTQWKTDYHDMCRQSELKLRDDDVLGIGCWGCAVTFHRAEVREVTGKGRFTRAAPVADSAPATPQPTIPTASAPFDAARARRHQEAWAKHLQVPVEMTNSVGMKFALIPPGEFDMGSSDQGVAYEMEEGRRAKPPVHKFYTDRVLSEKPLRRVKITKPFYLGACEVTQAEYQAVSGNNPSAFSATGGRKNVSQIAGADTSRHPVEMVSWDEAKQFLDQMSKLPAESSACRSYRLPTEAEWEHACRAGTTTRWWFGNDAASLPPCAWFKENSGGATHPVGQTRPNPWGLFDMPGNVFEWCSDRCNEGAYEPSETTDPQGPSDGRFHITRGGCYERYALSTRSAYRGVAGGSPWPVRSDFMGFRVVCEVAARSLPAPVAPAIAPAPQTTLPAGLRRGLALHFSFDADTGEKVADSSGMNNHGTAVGAKWTADGKNGGGFVFDRNQHYITVPHHPSLNPPELTTAAWIKTTYSEKLWLRIFDKCFTNGYAMSVAGYSDRQSWQGQAWWEAGTFGKAKSWIVSGFRIDDGQWHHIVGTAANPELRLYVDGVPVSNLGRAFVGTNTCDLTLGLGRSTPVEPFPNMPVHTVSFSGVMDDVMLFDRALSADEVKALFELQGSKITTATAAPTPTAPAVAAPSQPADGFQPLFNGRDLTGWVPMETTGRNDDTHRPTTGGWNVQDGELVCATAQPGWLKSERQYGNFVLQLEFKLHSGGNSGVYIRSPDSGRLSRAGLEIQVIDENLLPQGRKPDPSQLSGAICTVTGPSQPALRPMGQWNQMEIRCDGENIEVTLNGKRTAAANMGETPQLQDRPRSGYIGIANWRGLANGMAFRNIRIKELSAAPASPALVLPPPPITAPAQATGVFQPLFNGRDLSGWVPMKTVDNNDSVHQPTTGGWIVRDGELVCTTTENGWLRTERQYRDYVLQLEFKLLRDSNSDVYIRFPDSGRIAVAGMAIQIVDPNYRNRRLPPEKQIGSIYGVVGTDRPPVRPLGEWNSMEIRCEGDNIEVTLNGTRTASANMSQTPELRNRPRSGYVGIGNWHGEANGMSFRNIRLKELGAASSAPVTPQSSLVTPADDAFAREVAALPAVQQVARVVAKLKELNPNFDGKETHKLEGGAVTELAISTVSLRNLAPVGALKQLKKLTVAPWTANQKGALADLSPLRELPLTWLYCQNNPISDLSPLKGLPLTVLGCGSTQVSDLSPLAGMKLTVLSINDTAVSDLSSLSGMPLTVLWCNNTRVSDFAPLRSSLLQELRCDFQPQRDADALRGIPTLRKLNDQPAAALLKQAAVSTAGGDIRVLIVTGVDLGAHDWRATGPVIRNELQKDPRMKVEILNDIYRLDSMDLTKFQAVLLNFYTRGKPDPNEQARENLKNFVNRGGGLVIFHSTCGSFRDWPEFRDLAGKIMDTQKGGYDKQGPMRVKIANANHPITRGMQPYETNDELYAFLSGRKPVQVLVTAHARSTGSDEPMAFVFDYGKGRVFHFVLGHDVRAIETAGTAELLRRGTAWVAGREPAPLTTTPKR